MLLMAKVSQYSESKQFFNIICLNFQVEAFLCLDKQRTSKEDRKIRHPKRCVSTYYNKDEDNSPKNHNQNNLLVTRNTAQL